MLFTLVWNLWDALLLWHPLKILDSERKKELVLENKVYFLSVCISGVKDPCRGSTFPVAFIQPHNQQKTISSNQIWEYDYTCMKKCHSTCTLELLEYQVCFNFVKVMINIIIKTEHHVIQLNSVCNHTCNQTNQSPPTQSSDFVNHSHNCWQNWTPLSPISKTYYTGL